MGRPELKILPPIFSHTGGLIFFKFSGFVGPVDPYGGFERRVRLGDSFRGGGGQRGENALFVGGVVAVRAVLEVLPLSDF